MHLPKNHEHVSLKDFLAGKIPEGMSAAFYAVEQAEGAIPNGTRVRKVDSEPGDSHLNGARATVIGSMGPPLTEYKGHKNVYGYFVEWDDVPGVPCFITGFRIEAL